MRQRARDAAFAGLFCALIGAAWAGLLIWHASPYARYLHAFDWSAPGLLGEVCRILPGGAILVPALLYVGAWLLMIAAMMLPTIWPLLLAFRKVTSGRSDAVRLLLVLASGYLLAWLGFGVIAAGADGAVRQAVSSYGWLLAHAWALGAATLALAGLYQFSRWKYLCLDRCRSPLSFVMESWRGRNAWVDAFRLGLRHGAFCVGCCWTLMLVMFVVGVGSIVWMLGLAAVMAAEKSLPAGRRLAPVTGVVLLVAAAWVAASEGWPDAWF